MNALLSLPRIRRGAMKTARAVPPSVRARAGRELRHALRLGRISPAQLDEALRAGDAGIAALMAEHHVVRGTIRCEDTGLAPRWTPNDRTRDTLVAWARSLRAAKRLDDAALAAIPRHTAFEQLLRLCAEASVVDSASVLQRLPGLPYQGDGDAVFAVGTTYAERLFDSGYGSHEPDDAPVRIMVEIVGPNIASMPEFADADDRYAVFAAMERIRAADPFGLWAGPQDALWILDHWACELMTDVRNQAAKRANGEPDLRIDDLRQLEEELGIDTSDPESAMQSAYAHLAYLDRIEGAARWHKQPLRLTRWRARRKGSTVASLVDYLLAVADAIRLAAPKRGSFEQDGEGEPAAAILVEQPPRDALWAMQNVEHYGMSETPLLFISPSGAKQNPASFWSLHDSVVMVATLVTAAHDAVLSYTEEAADARLAA